MNEKINILFGRALDETMPNTWATLNRDQLDLIKDKFAELILKQCISLIEDNNSPFCSMSESAWRKVCREEIELFFNIKKQ